MSRGKASTSSQLIRVVLGVLLIVTCIRVWTGPVRWIPEARAQIPNAGSQRIELLREARRTNELLYQILETLQTRTIKVEVRGTDNTKAPGARLPSRRQKK